MEGTCRDTRRTTPPPDAARATETLIDARTTPIGRGRVTRLVFRIYRPRSASLCPPRRHLRSAASAPNSNRTDRAVVSKSAQFFFTPFILIALLLILVDK